MRDSIQYTHMSVKGGRVIFAIDPALANTSTKGIVGELFIRPVPIELVANGKCQKDFLKVLRALKRMKYPTIHDVFKVDEAYLETRYRGLGIGTAMYEHALTETCAKGQVFMLVADECIEGDTSRAASLVYQRLRTKYVAAGLILTNVPNAKRKLSKKAPKKRKV